jgi:hypothetical protein
MVFLKHFHVSTMEKTCKGVGHLSTNNLKEGIGEEEEDV